MARSARISDMYRTHRFGPSGALLLVCSSLIGLGCGTHAGTEPDNGVTGAGTEHPGTEHPASEDPGAKVSAWPATLIVSARDPIPESLQQGLSAASALDREGLEEAYPAPSAEDVKGDLSSAAGMDLIQGSSLALNGTELAALEDNGLVISASEQFPSFAYGYKTIYSQDLPVYVSADSILEAMHRSFDQLLSISESEVLIGELSTLIEGMRSNLKRASFEPKLAADLDLYLTVAASLLKGKLVDPVAGGSATQIANLYQSATTAQGHGSVTLFESQRDEDFSQFEPRGHYTDSDQLRSYFRAMIWLGRVDLRVLEAQGDGTSVFHRRQFDAAVAMTRLLGPDQRTLWNHIDSTIGAFTGEHDSATPQDMLALLNSLLAADPSTLSNEQIVAEIERQNWGAQRIASRIIVKAVDGPTLPLDRSYLLFGQRYTADSHTLSNVSFDRTSRLMPKPLDAAFSALGNNAALPLLSGDFGDPSYIPALAATRTLVDAHEPAYWEGSLYTRWLGALRSLSPQPQDSNVVQSSAWQKRILSTQLGSWAELRHDTILYTKQSYSAGVTCEFPDAYVDPYPEFYARLGAFAEATASVVRSLQGLDPTLRTALDSWTANFQTAMSNLRTMAEDQLSGAPHSPELLSFINDAVKWDEQPGCGGPSASNFSGWYFKLYFNQYQALDVDPVVADVHTQPTDAVGNDVGRILHVGTGLPRLMVVTANTCQGPRAYAGLAFSYGELITAGWQRLSDEEWATKIIDEPFPDVAWMSDVIAQ
jgi:hypothetical protein